MPHRRSLRIAPRRRAHADAQRLAFTLIELLVVISIISLLMSILLPSLSRAREQAKGVHCLARLKEFGTALATYENANSGAMPPALWYPDQTDIESSVTVPVDPNRRIEYGWAELLFTHVYREPVRLATSYPVLRNVEGWRWQKYFICQAVGDEGVNSGDYRVYLPAWGAGVDALGPDRVYTDEVHASPLRSAHREQIRPKMPLIGDANEFSERGDGLGNDDCSYIDAGEANYAGSDGSKNGNRFSDRHYGGTNYLFADLHAAWNPHLRDELARDYDLNGTIDLLVQPQP
jgi:prepilin-type N-terminal cleavage/methylation domain-containing protein/prepilin-type processing-associated H-X9-DG protein